MRRLYLSGFLCLILGLFSFTGFSGDPAGGGLAGIADDAQSKATELLRNCANEMGIETSGQAVFSVAEDTSAAIIPVAGADKLSRADLADWQAVGVVVSTAPSDTNVNAKFPLLIEVQAKIGTTQGCFRISDADGRVVQEGEMTIEEAPDDKSSAFQNGETVDKALYCYYPYWSYFRIYPRYWFGSWYWYYRYPWGYYRFYWNWYYYPGYCCGSYWWWWWWRC